jgi:TatD DNase family protein
LDYIDIHTHSGSVTGKSILNIFPADNLSENPGRLFSIGLHPWYIDQKSYIEKIEIVRIWAKCNTCMAIGETGLDKLAKSDFNLQLIIFDKHIEIAEEFYKPLIIHCVRAFEEIIELKKATGSKVPWIVHGFNSKIQIAEKLINEGMLLSFGKALGNKDSNAAKVMGRIPENSFFLETDDSDLEIQEIYDFGANIRESALTELMAMIQNKFEITYNLPNE